MALVAGLAAWQFFFRNSDRKVAGDVPNNDREVVDKGVTFRMGPDGVLEIEMAQRPPMSKVALVRSPAAIEGVRSWTIETRGHRGEVHTVRYSPNGNLMATGGEDGTIRVWDPKTGELDKALVGHDGPVQDLSWSPDSQQLASGADDDTVRFWDVPSGNETQKTKVDNPSKQPLFVSFSPDGNTLAYGGAEGVIHLWDVESGEVRKLDGPKEGVRSVSWAGDGQTLVAANANATLTVWDVTSGQARATLKGHAGLVTDVDISPDDKTVASSAASPGEDESVRLWDLATGEPRNTLPAHKHGAECIVFSPNGRLLVSGGAEGDGRLRVWNIDTGKLVYEQEPHEGNRSIASVTVSPDGNMLAVAHHDGTVRLCDLETGDSIRSLPKAEQPVSVSPEGHLPETPTDDGEIVYVAATDAGQTTSSPSGFFQLYAWTNDPQQAVGGGHAAPAKSDLASSRPNTPVPPPTEPSPASDGKADGAMATEQSPTATESTVQPGITVADGWVDVMPMIDLVRDVIQGEWSLDDGKLIPATTVGAKTEMPCLCLPIDLPTGYELTISYSISNEHFGMVVQLPVGQVSQPVYVSGQPAKKDSLPRGKVVLGHLNKMDGGEKTAGDFSHHVGRPVELTVRVAPENGAQVRIHVRLDKATKEPEWVGTPADLVALEVPLGDSPRVTISAYNYAVQVRSIRIRALTDEPNRATQTKPLSD
jgi:WD40 repeat protein